MNFRQSWATYSALVLKMHNFSYILLRLHFWNNFQAFSGGFYSPGLYTSKFNRPVENWLRYFFTQENFLLQIEDCFNPICSPRSCYSLISSPNLSFSFPSLQLPGYATRWLLIQRAHTVKWLNPHIQHINYLGHAYGFLWWEFFNSTLSNF